jgi:hypothetical protein
MVSKYELLSNDECSDALVGLLSRASFGLNPGSVVADVERSLLAKATPQPRR